MSTLCRAPTGHPTASPGQRPGKLAHPNNKALTGRPKLCPNPLRAARSPRLQHQEPRTPPARHRTRFLARLHGDCRCKTLVARPSLSIQSPITFTSSWNLVAPWRSATPWKRSRRLPRNGLRPRARVCPVCLASRLWGVCRFGVERHRRMQIHCGPAGTSSQKVVSGSRSRSSHGIAWFSTNDMSGIKTPFQGFLYYRTGFPERCPGLVLNRPFGAGRGEKAFRGRCPRLVLNRFVGPVGAGRGEKTGQWSS